MRDMHDDELTPAEARGFATLPRETQAGDLLEERTVNALAGRGWIRSRRRLPAPLAWAGAAAACLVFFVAGFSIGQSRSEIRSTGIPALIAGGNADFGARSHSTRHRDARDAREGRLEHDRKNPIRRLVLTTRIDPIDDSEA